MAKKSWTQGQKIGYLFLLSTNWIRRFLRTPYTEGFWRKSTESASPGPVKCILNLTKKAEPNGPASIPLLLIYFFPGLITQIRSVPSKGVPSFSSPLTCRINSMGSSKCIWSISWISSHRGKKRCNVSVIAVHELRRLGSNRLRNPAWIIQVNGVRKCGTSLTS